METFLYFHDINISIYQWQNWKTNWKKECSWCTNLMRHKGKMSFHSKVHHCSEATLKIWTNEAVWGLSVGSGILSWYKLHQWIWAALWTSQLLQFKKIISSGEHFEEITWLCVVHWKVVRSFLPPVKVSLSEGESFSFTACFWFEQAEKPVHTKPDDGLLSPFFLGLKHKSRVDRDVSGWYARFSRHD